MAEANDFVKEIQMMMFGLGDSQTPLLSTAQVIQEIVKQQLTLLLDKANEIAEMRESPCIELQDIVFLLRKDSAKLKRLLQYLEMKDTKMGLPRLMAEMDPSKSVQNKRQTKGNRKEECIKFLSSIGIEYEDSVEDQVKMERLIRANQIAQSLNEKSYQELHKSRKCSFASTRLNQVKLIEWLKTSAEDDPVSKLKKDNIDVIVYFAKEIVAQLVDLALLVRQDAIAVAGDPLSRAIDPLPTRSTDIYGCDKNLIQGPEPISVNEIRDVMRRFWSTNLYPFSTVTVNTFNPVDHRLLVC